MILTPNHITQLTNIAIEAATSAGRLIASYNAHDLEVKTKEGMESLSSQVVTEVDLKAQACILEILQPSIQQYDLGLLAEESEDDHSRLVKDYFWAIDPLDGTLPFTKKQSGYAVSIALINKAGTAIIGVVYNPLSETLYHASAGHGAFRNHQPWALQTTALTLTWIMNRSFDTDQRLESTREKVEQLAKDHNLDGVDIINHGGSVMNALWCLENAPAIYFALPKKAGGGSIWDYAATACIFKEMTGSTPLNFQNSPLHLNDSETFFMNKQGVLYGSEHKFTTSVLEVL